MKRRCIALFAALAIVVFATAGCDSTAAPYTTGGQVQPADCPNPWKWRG